MELAGRPSPAATPKDVVLACLRKLGAGGLLGAAAEYYGDVASQLSLDGRITVASMATEMGGIITFLPPSDELLARLGSSVGTSLAPTYADPDAVYSNEIEIDVEGLEPLISRPGHPDDVVRVEDVAGHKVDSVFVGSCTNGRIEDLLTVAEILRDRTVARDVVLKIVPSTDRIWRLCLKEGLIEIFKSAGALVGNAGCAGCAAGQIGQNGPGEVTVSTGNRNFPGKQGRGDVFLASPATAAASAVAGEITTAGAVAPRTGVFVPEPVGVRARGASADSAQVTQTSGDPHAAAVTAAAESAGIGRKPAEGPTSDLSKPTEIRGRIVLVPKDNIDTDMIYHNRHLAVTDIEEMGKYAFGNLPGWEDFPKKARPGDIVVTGSNFGCGSSRQQAVDCFASLGVAAIIAKSFGAIYERNAINAGMPIVIADLVTAGLADGDEIEVDFGSGEIRAVAGGAGVSGRPFSAVQMQIYQRGGLLKSS
jgi:3-isopropylmalate dehydratase small subunit